MTSLVKSIGCPTCNCIIAGDPDSYPDEWADDPCDNCRNKSLRARVAELEALAREVVRHGTWVEESDVCLVHIDDCIYCMARAALRGEGDQ